MKAAYVVPKLGVLMDGEFAGLISKIDITRALLVDIVGFKYGNHVFISCICNHIVSLQRIAILTRVFLVIIHFRNSLY